MTKYFSLEIRIMRRCPRVTQLGVSCYLLEPSLLWINVILSP